MNSIAPRWPPLNIMDIRLLSRCCVVCQSTAELRLGGMLRTVSIGWALSVLVALTGRRKCLKKQMHPVSNGVLRPMVGEEGCPRDRHVTWSLKNMRCLQQMTTVIFTVDSNLQTLQDSWGSRSQSGPLTSCIC